MTKKKLNPQDITVETRIKKTPTRWEMPDRIYFITQQ